MIYSEGVKFAVRPKNALNNDSNNYHYHYYYINGRVLHDVRII